MATLAKGSGAAPSGLRPASDAASFEAFLSGLDYRFQLDENNDAYHRFLTHDSQR